MAAESTISAIHGAYVGVNAYLHEANCDEENIHKPHTLLPGKK